MEYDKKLRELVFGRPQSDMDNKKDPIRCPNLAVRSNKQLNISADLL